MPIVNIDTAEAQLSRLAPPLDALVRLRRRLGMLDDVLAGFEGR